MGRLWTETEVRRGLTFVPFFGKEELLLAVVCIICSSIPDFQKKTSEVVPGKETALFVSFGERRPAQEPFALRMNDQQDFLIDGWHLEYLDHKCGVNFSLA